MQLAASGIRTLLTLNIMVPPLAALGRCLGPVYVSGPARHHQKVSRGMGLWRKELPRVSMETETTPEL